jgi:hypothetical protein
MAQYPVIAAHTANRESLLYTAPHLVTTTSNRNLSQRSHKQRRKAKAQDTQGGGKGKKKDAEPVPKDSPPSGSSRLVDAFGDAEPEEQVGLLQAHEDEPRQDALDEEQSQQQSRYSIGEERDVWGSEG